MLTCLFVLIGWMFVDYENCPRFDFKLYVGCIQNRNLFFLPPHVCGRFWQWCRLSVQTCLLQLIYPLDLNFPSSYLCHPYFVDCWLLRIIFIGSGFIYPEPFPWVWFKIVSGMYPNRTYIFASPSVFGSSWQGCQSLWFHLLSSIHLLAWRQFLKVVNVYWYINLTEDCSLCWSYIYALVKWAPRPIRLVIGQFLVDCWWLIFKPHIILFLLLVFYIRFSPRGTNAHWFNPWKHLGMFLEIDI